VFRDPVQERAGQNESRTAITVQFIWESCCPRVWGAEGVCYELKFSKVTVQINVLHKT
jgi:hypothetical protein